MKKTPLAALLPDILGEEPDTPAPDEEPPDEEREWQAFLRGEQPPTKQSTLARLLLLFGIGQ